MPGYKGLYMYFLRGKSYRRPNLTSRFFMPNRQYHISNDAELEVEGLLYLLTVYLALQVIQIGILEGEEYYFLIIILPEGVP